MDSDSDFYDDEYEFEPAEVTSGTRKEYRSLGWSDIQKAQEEATLFVANILALDESVAHSLLAHFHWKKDNLIDAYIDNSDKILEKAGLVPGFIPKINTLPVCCDICCNDVEESFSLNCGHFFCMDCYRQYLSIKINEGESRTITCPASKCSLLVDESTMKLLLDPVFYEKYQRLLIRTYVEDHEYLRWCPAPNCEYAVECHVSESQLTEIVPTVECACGNVFCFGCGLADHQPSICPLVKLWLKKCADDSETSNWISANTKECTKCKSIIEKNGGCNHMTCQKCRYEFCWVCMGPWSEHGNAWYNCNRFDESSSVNARDQQTKSRAALDRYLHYYNRYANHESSAKLDKSLFEKTERKMEAMQRSSDLSWIEVQFLQKAVHVLLESRMTLKWTYSFAYYLERNNMTMLFEDNQRDLEIAVEQLSELLESELEPSKIPQLKLQVLDKTVYVSHRRDVVLKDTAKGLQEGRWKYNVSLT